jgi:hypothetical protein
VGTAHAGRGGGAGQGKTDRDAPRQRRDDGAERSGRSAVASGGGGVPAKRAVAWEAAGDASERKKHGGMRTENRAAVPL